MSKLKAPFPYFGAKSRASDEVWRRFGNVHNYVEPFAGSLAVLLGRPEPFTGTETVNDADGLLSNFWRAMVYDPEGVISHADWPVNEADLHARHLWLVGARESLTLRLMADPDWYDVKAAGWWVWGVSAWIGSGWCSGEGPWSNVNGIFQKVKAGEGVNRKLPRLDPGGSGINKKKTPTPNQFNAGVNTGVGYWLAPIAERIKNVRVACGDWTRVLGGGINHASYKTTGIFLDPPYPEGKIDYVAGDRETYQDVQAWALKRGDDPRFRIAVCGYDKDHETLTEAGWTPWAWKATGGYENQGSATVGTNSKRETIWFSPHCLPDKQLSSII